MDVFQNLLLTKRKTQEDEISDILFKPRKTSNYHMEQAITSVAYAASGLLQTKETQKRWQTSGLRMVGQKLFLFERILRY